MHSKSLLIIIGSLAGVRIFPEIESLEEVSEGSDSSPEKASDRPLHSACFPDCFSSGNPLYPFLAGNQIGNFSDGAKIIKANFAAVECHPKAILQG